MAGHWLRLTLTALAAAVVVIACDGVLAAPKKAAPAAGKEDQPEAAEDGKAAPKKPVRKKQDPAEASRAIEAAAKLLEAGKSEQAAQALSTVIGGGNLPPAIMAKALLYRGIAYRQQKKPAEAIADLTSALWLKGGLAEQERKDALRQRTSAYQEAGLSDTGEPVTPAMPTGAGPRAATAAGLSEDGSPSAAAPPKQTSGWSFGNPFATLFGGGSSASAPQPAPPPTTTASIEPSPPAPAREARPASSGWSRNTEVRGGSPPASTPVAAAAPQPEGKYRIQIAMVRTQAEALALAARVKQEHAAMLGAREPQIDEAVVGNMGSFYRVRIGPFASAHEGQAACTRLKGPGIDCLVVTQ
jgi:hypothetical protein